MKIIAVCISLALVACTRGKTKSYIDDHFRLFGVESGKRSLHSAARAGSKDITGGLYLPACSRGKHGGRGRGGGNGSNFQDLGTGGAGSLSNQVGKGAADSNTFQGWGAGAGGVSNQGGSAGGSISNIQGWGAGAGGFSSQGIGGAAGGSKFQGSGAGTGGETMQGGSGRGGRSLPGAIGNAAGYSRGPVSSKNRGGKRGAGSFSNQGGSGLGGYQNVLVDLQTSEGRNIDPQLLEQVRFILLQEEASSGLGGGASPSSSSFSAPSSSYGAPSTNFGAPSSAYGAPSAESGGDRYGRDKSGRVVGIVFEGIYQSIQIGENHQTTSKLGPSSRISPLMTSPIPSRSFASL